MCRGRRATRKEDLRSFLSRDGLENPPVRAAEAIRECRVVDVSVGSLTLTFFRSKVRDYLIIPETYCSCRDFEFNVILRGRRPACYHLVAEALARRGGRVRRLAVGDEDELYAILLEALYTSRSNSLRKLLIKAGK